ncbi:MAG TPA: VOC family protein, partial [Solirubrobacterales bacterium]
MNGPRDVLHFSFTVADLEASIDWYTRVLGLELVHRQRQENAYTAELVGIEGAVLEIAQFRVPGVSPGLSTHMLELVEYVRPRVDPVDLPTNRPGVAHIAFLVDDIHDRYEAMRRQGVVFRNPPTAIAEGANAGGWACYFHDP